MDSVPKSGMPEELKGYANELLSLLRGVPSDMPLNNYPQPYTAADAIRDVEQGNKMGIKLVLDIKPIEDNRAASFQNMPDEEYKRLRAVAEAALKRAEEK